MNVKFTREAYGQMLVELGKDHEFLVMDADLSKATQTTHFAKAYPDRFLNMGISEQDMMTTAAGIASCGLTVFASTFAMFGTGRAYEQIRNSICYPNLNVKIACTHGGVLIGEDGATHQALEDIALMRGLPNMKVVVPCDVNEVEAVMREVMQLSGPCYLRFGRTSSPQVYETVPSFTLGKGHVIRDGTQVALFAIGDMVYEALQAAKLLETQGVSAAVINMASVKPLDEALVLRYARSCGVLVSIEDHSIIGGLGSAIAEVVAHAGIGRLQRLGIQDTFGRSGTREELLQYFHLDHVAIAENVKVFLDEVMV